MDLSRYDRKKVRIRTEDGKIFAGRADVYPTSYGLHEFNRQEESIRIRRIMALNHNLVIPQKHGQFHLIHLAKHPDRSDIIISKKTKCNKQAFSPGNRRLAE